MHIDELIIIGLPPAALGLTFMFMLINTLEVCAEKKTVSMCISGFLGNVISGAAYRRFFILNLSILLLILLFIRPVQVCAEEDVLRLLIWEGYAPEKFVKEFEREIELKYGRKVKMDISFVKGSDDFYDPVRSKTIDVITICHHLMKDERFQYIAKKLILPLDLNNIPNQANLMTELKKADYHACNGKTYGVPVANGPYGLAYNTKRLNQSPQSWKIFWDPAFKNKYTVGAYEYLYNINITALALGYPRESISCYGTLNNRKFREKLKLLAVNAHSFWIGQDKPDDLIGLSLAAIWGDSIKPLSRMGEVWKMADPVEGTLWWVDDYAITWALKEKPFLKKVAEEWINKVLSPGFQIEHIVRESGLYPVVINISDKLSNEERKRIQIGMPGSNLDNRILQHTYSQVDREAMKLMWDEAMKGVPVTRQE